MLIIFEEKRREEKRRIRSFFLYSVLLAVFA
jgi:hypothetical protein